MISFSAQTLLLCMLGIGLVVKSTKLTAHQLIYECNQKLSHLKVILLCIQSNLAVQDQNILPLPTLIYQNTALVQKFSILKCTLQPRLIKHITQITRLSSLIRDCYTQASPRSETAQAFGPKTISGLIGILKENGRQCRHLNTLVR